MKKSFCLTAVLLILALVRVFGQCDTIAVFPFTETFEDISPSRACWTQQQVIGNNIWTFTDGSISGPPALAYEGDINACFTDDGNGEVTKLISPVFDLSAYSSSCILTFYYAQGNWFGDQNILKVYYRTSSVNPWVLIFTDNTNRPAWVYKTLPLPSPSASYQIAFEGIDNYGYANVVDLVSILPPCAAVDSFPFTETFENNSPTRYCWTQEAVANNKTWGFESGALMGNVDTAHSGAFNAYFSSDWTLNCVTRLISPVFNLSGASMPYQLSFYYAQEENNGSQNYLNVYYRSSPASGWLLLFSDSTNRPDWTLANVTLPNPSPFYQLAFEGIANYGFPNVIDKVMISGCSIPQMIQLTNITTDSATVQWMSGGFEYQWDLKIAEAGFDPDTEGILHPGIMMTSHQLTNLSQGTRYDVYLRPVCNPADTNPWIGPYRFNTLYTIPYFENFDSAGNYPTAPGWQSIAYSTYANHNPKVLKTGQAYSEPYCININDCIMPVKKAPTLQNQSEEDFLITPEVEEVILISPEMIVSLDQLRVSFYAISDGDPTYCGLCSLSIGTMSDPTDYNTFTAYQLIPLSDMWQYYIVNLNNYSGTNAYVGFKLVLSDLASGSALIDNILFSYLPSCFEPSDLQVDTATENEITIKWVPGQNEMQWDVQYGPQGFTQGTLVQGLTDSTFTAANLQASSTFDFYVRADCQNDDLSAWTGPLTVNTLCGPMTAPILQNFDNTATASLPNCWSAIMSGYSIVQVQENSYTSAPNSLMIYNDASLQDTVFFVTPAITNALNTLMISFQSMSYNWGNILTLGTMSDPTDPTTFTAVYDLIQIPEFTAWSWDFGEYSGTDQYIAFRLIDDEVILLDDIVIESTILCEMPASLTVEQITQTSVTISWLALNAESSWDILYGEAGFDPQAGGVFLEGITANPYVVSNLNPGISYDFYVWALCGNGEYSNRSGPLVATTSCESQNLPWYENFESTPSGTLPPCILTADDNQDGQTWTTAYDNNDNAAIVLLPAVGDQFQDDWFFSPPFPLLAGHSYTISFDYMGFPANPNNYITVYNGTSATVLAMGDTSIYGTAVPLDTYSTASFQFIPAADGINVFGWNCVSGFPQSTLFIDNISISETVQISCPQSIFACTAGPPILLTGATPLGGVYSGVNVYQNQTMDYVFDPATLSAGQYVVTYTYSTSFTSSSCDFIILVSDLPVVTCPAAINIAPGDAPFLLTGGNPEGGNFYGQAVVNNMFNPGMANMGPNSILYMYTDPVSLCQGSCSFVVTMNEVVNLSCPPDFNICVTASPIVLSGASPAGGVYSGSGVYLNQTLEYVFSPAAFGPGAYPITYTYTTQYGSYSCTFTANVIALPVVSCPADMNVGNTAAAFTLSGASPAGGTYSGQAVINNMFNPAMAVIGPNNVQYSYLDPITLCQSNCEFTVEVVEVVSVSCPPDFNICITASPIVLSGASPAGGVYSGSGVYLNQTLEYMFSPAAFGPGAYPITYTYTTQYGSYSCTFTANVIALPVVSCPADMNVGNTAAAFTLSGASPAGGTYTGQAVINNMFNPAMAVIGPNNVQYSYLDPITLCQNHCEFTVEVVEVVSVSCPPDFNICITASPIVLSGASPAGGVYSGSGVYLNQTLEYVFSPAAFGPGAYPITYTYTTQYGSYSCTFTANVIALPVVSCPADMNVGNTAAAFTLSGASLAGGTYSGQAVINNMFNPAMAVIGPNNVQYSYLDPITLCQSNCEFTVEVVEVVSVSCPPDFNICVTAFPIVLSGASPAGGVYSGSGVYLNQTQEYVFSPAAFGPGSYPITYTYTTQYGSYSCTFTANVIALPVVSCPADMNVGNTAAAFTLSGASPAGGSYSGQAVINNMFNPAMAMIGSNNVLYSYLDPLTLCQSNCEFTVEVSEVISVSCPPDFNICVTASPIVLSGASPAGGVYSGSGVYLNQTLEYVFDPAAFGPGAYPITYTYTTQYGSYSCTFTANVIALPVVSCPADMNVGNTAAAFTLSGASPAGGSYSGQAVINNMFNPAMAVIGPNNVQYSYLDPITLCQSNCEFTVEVVEVVSVSCPPDFNICVTASTIILSGASPAGGVYSGAGVVLNQNLEYTYSPAPIGPGTYPLTYTYTTQYGSYSCTFNANVLALPVVSCPADMSVGNTAAAFTLSGGSPAGGSYSGQAVINNMFNPAMAVIGPNNVQYSYLDPITLCQSNCEFTVEVVEVVSVSCPPDFNICVTASPIVLSGASPAGGVYSGSGVYLNQTLEYVFDPALVIPGNYTITYTYTTQNGIYACTFVATVNDLPSITCPADIDYCWGNPAFVLTGSAPAGGTYSGSGITGNTFDPNVAGLGSHVITYTYTNANACTSLCEFSIHVIEGQLMSVIVQADTLSACLGEVITVEAMPLNAGSNPLIQWYINNQLQANTNAILQLPFQVNSSVYCVVSSSAPCTLGNPATSNTLSVNILPNLFPSLIISADDDTVCEGSMVTYHVVSVADTGNSPIFQWQVNGINTGGNSQTYTYLPGNADLVKCLLFVNEPCVSQSPANSNSISTIIIPTPLVLLNLAVDTMCINWDPIILTGGTPLGGTYSGPGVSNQEFDPVLAGSGNHQIGYSYMDSWGCQNTVYASVLVDVCTGLPMNPELNPLLLYPNPANDILVIRTGSLDVNPGTILITDLPGRQQKCAIVEHDNTGLVLDISGLKPGLYTIRLDQEFRKFLIVR